MNIGFLRIGASDRYNSVIRSGMSMAARIVTVNSRPIAGRMAWKDSSSMSATNGGIIFEPGSLAFSACVMSVEEWTGSTSFTI